MTINMEKGSNISLEKDGEAIVRFTVGLGWDASNNGNNIDLDASVFVLNDSGKAKETVYFNNKKSTCGSIVHGGDNLTGQGDGDDETIEVDLSKIPSDIEKAIVVVNIYQAKERNQSFGLVRNAYARIVADGVEIARYDLQEDGGSSTALTFAEIYKKNGQWKFRALGELSKKSLSELAAQYA